MRRTSNPKATHEVDNRARELFRLLVEQYLESGDPVGSATIADLPSVSVSPATVRIVMADLEAVGLVRSPHTSAGKMPTQQGLRFFIDSLLYVRPLDVELERTLRERLSDNQSPSELVASASELLARISHLAGLVTTPRPEQVELRQVEFLKLSGSRVLAILVVNEREVQNRVIETDREYLETELREAANFINREYCGRSLVAIRRELLDSMQKDKNRLDRLMQTTLDVASKTFEPEDDEIDYVVKGERNLMSFLSSSEDVQGLLDAFTRKSAIVHLLDRCIGTDGVQLFIGTESGYEPFEDYSVVTSTYEVDGKVAGVLGVVGPTYMAYQKLIPLVDVTSRLLGTAIERSHA